MIGEAQSTRRLSHRNRRFTESAFVFRLRLVMGISCTARSYSLPSGFFTSTFV